MSWLDLVARLLAVGARTAEGRALLARAAQEQTPLLPLTPDESGWSTDWATDPAEWRRRITTAIASAIAEGWDRYGAPSAARDPEGEGYIASAEGPGEPITVRAGTKREAYREARREWVRRLLE